MPPATALVEYCPALGAGATSAAESLLTQTGMPPAAASIPALGAGAATAALGKVLNTPDDDDRSAQPAAVALEHVLNLTRISGSLA